MMINIGKRFPTGNIAFFSSRNAALFEFKMMQHTTLSIEVHHCTMSELKTQVLILADVLACFSINCADLKQHPNPDFLPNSVNITLETCVDIANEYLQSYNIVTEKLSCSVCSLHQCNFAGYTKFSFLIVLSN